ncbi:MAG: hypothetical protein KJN59_00355, partial [Bacteroidia bacterium]|nr:hypothetical protein [Bacteroidia bacterium]
MNVTTLKKCSPAFLGLLLIHLCFSSYGISLKNIPMEAAQSEEVCGETAFAFLNDDDDMSTADAASTCFLPEFTRWGWTTLLDFSEETGQSSYTLDIYAGAGQCDLSKGTDVGSVVVTYNADSSITFDYNLEGYVLSEAHIYVGVDEYPTHNGSETVAPGQYTYVDSEVGDLQDYSVTIPAEGTMLYVIVHGVTSHADCDDPN